MLKSSSEILEEILMPDAYKKSVQNPENSINNISVNMSNYFINTFCIIVFPPAPKKGMVKLPGKGHFNRVTTG